MDIVLDTNCLIMALSPKSRYRIIWQSFLNGDITLCVTNDIIEEYEEVIARNIGARVAKIAISIISNSTNVRFVDPHFNFWLIENDVDDNKFTDCAIVAHAKYIVTEDHHFQSAAKINFPKVNIIDIDQFMNLLSS